MRTHFSSGFLLFATLAIAPGATFAQRTTHPTGKPGQTTLTPEQRGVELAGKGECTQALPLLKRALYGAAAGKLSRQAGLAGARCASLLDQPDSSLDFLRALQRRFPHDPEVLYQLVHAYSELSLRVSEQLLKEAPLSIPAQELDAESLEMRGKWAEAKQIYLKILAAHPNTRGIHYRLGRIILSEPKTATTFADAKTQFEDELKVDPTNAGAEYVLGEMALQTQQWQPAALHFSRATKLDPRFPEAFLGLGIALNSLGEPTRAVPALRQVTKLEPANPAGHYQLALAYNRLGRKQAAARQIALFRQASAKAAEEQKRQVQGKPQGQPPR